MAGKPVGEYSTKFTSLSVSQGPAGSILIQGNSEGTATGFGAILATAYFVGAKSGTYSLVSIAALDNGESLSGTGSGTYETIGKHRWRTHGILEISDGRRLAGEGEVDLATRSWNGTLFEG